MNNMQENGIDIPEIKLTEMNDMKVTPSVTEETYPTTNTLNEDSSYGVSKNPFKKLKRFLASKRPQAFSGTGSVERNKALRITGIVLGVILLLLVIMGVAIAIPGFAIYGIAKVL